MEWQLHVTLRLKSLVPSLSKSTKRGLFSAPMQKDQSTRNIQQQPGRTDVHPSTM